MTDDESHRARRIRLVRPAAGPEAGSGRAAIREDGSPDWSMLMACAQIGDRDAYRRLLESVTPYLRRLAARHGVHPDAVEDVVQDILITLHQVRHTYAPERPFGPWLVSIASRRIVDALRRQGRAASREMSLDPNHETLAGDGANLMEEAADAQVLRGYAVFKRTCFACHTMNGAGDARLGPDLNLPWNPTEYLRPDLLRGFIRNPQTLHRWPEAKMQGFPTTKGMSDADLDAVLAYLRYMAKHKTSPP